MTSSSAAQAFSAPSITRDSALALIAAARTAAHDLGIAVTIAVTDAGGHLRAFERADSAPFLTAEVAIDKAWSAASFGLGTHVWNTLLRNEAISQLAQRPRLVAVGGGCPIVLDGQVIGAIGISGGNALQDQQAAEAALAALGFTVAG